MPVPDLTKGLRQLLQLSYIDCPAADAQIFEVKDATWVKGDPPQTDHSRCQIKMDQLRSVQEYIPRFQELLAQGHPWLNVELWGLYQGRPIVAIVASEKTFGPNVKTAINWVGPPKGRKPDAAWQMELV